jgi:predicted DCC family thiol-disulfide oxidoreductase YuxK
MGEPAPPELLFYDGGCGLCHRAVLFVLRFDPQGRQFRFAPLGGPTFQEKLQGVDAQGLPDSIVVLTNAGAVLTRSSAMLHILRRLGGIWAPLGAMLRLVPRGLRDGAYDFVARVRHRLFARPKDACPLLPPALRARFLP